MSNQSGISGARLDIANGRLWKARDRLNGVVHADPANQEAIELLAEVHFAMGDLPQAGRYWFLTERDGGDVDQALTAFKERFPRPAQRVFELPVRTTPADYPESVQRRLEALINEASVDEHRLLLRQRRTAWVSGAPYEPQTRPKRRLLKGLWKAVATVVALLFTLGVWIAGAIAIINWLT